MSDLDATTPRVFLARHGETEWTKSGQYTGISDIELTAAGVTQVTATGSRLVGSGKLIDPSRIAHVWVSPRNRAQHTFRLLFNVSENDDKSELADKITITEDIREWDYGDYEGMVVGDIKAQRKAKGLDKDRGFNIWRDGCENGESPAQVTQRLDKLISQVQELQAPHMNGDKPVDVVLVAHGLILRAFVKRWLKYDLGADLPLMFSPGAIGILSYKNHRVDEPALYFGMALPSQE